MDRHTRRAEGGAEARLVRSDGAGEPEIVLSRDRVVLGSGSVDALIADPTVSRLHLALERVTGGWIVQDLGSRNGTYVNGERVLGPRALRPGDELRLGTTLLRFRVGGTAPEDVTDPLSGKPQLTRRERDVLVGLCRPLLRGSLLSEPASTAEIASELVLSESAVKKLLVRTYDKFGLRDRDRRRHRLAAEALRRGAVSPADL